MTDDYISNIWTMSIMATAPFSIRLKPELRSWLDEEAKRQERSAAYLAAQAIQALKEKTEAKSQLIRDAIVEADNGVFISEDKMTAWFESLGTDHELPEPEADVFLSRN